MKTKSHFEQNLLCYGDNLTFLKNGALFPNECIDLIYLDPPFNSKRPYNVLFKDVDGTPSAAQIKAFDDTWQWDQDAADKLLEIQAVAPSPLVELLKELQGFLGHSEMYAYLVQMAVRLVQLHRLLKPTGSLYLHCDPTASHYLKMVLDGIFGARYFLNEITWKRSSAHSDIKQGMRRCGRIRDILLLYTKSVRHTWNPVYVPYDESYIKAFYRHVEPETGRRYRLGDLTAGKPGGDTLYEWKGKRPYKRRYWAYGREKMEQFEREGRLIYTGRGMPCYKRYLDEMPGVPVQDLWDDIPYAATKERLGYPTQKPIGLLKRVVTLSSNPGDVILDPFCGCGTTIDAVETINREKDKDGKRPKPRQWIGIDVTHLAIHLIKHRLTRFTPPPRYEVVGEPADLAGARFLAQKDRFQFQFWALGLVGARAWGGVERKGADTGIDGVRYFTDDPSGKPKTVLAQVKSGHVKAGGIRDFRGVLERQRAAIGLFLTLENPTKDMKAEAAAAGHYHSPGFHKDYPRLQILTIAELLADPEPTNPRCLRIPAGSDLTFHKAAQYDPPTGSTGSLDLLEPVAHYETTQRDDA